MDERCWWRWKWNEGGRNRCILSLSSRGDPLRLIYSKGMMRHCVMLNAAFMTRSWSSHADFWLRIINQLGRVSLPHLLSSPLRPLRNPSSSIQLRHFSRLADRFCIEIDEDYWIPSVSRVYAYLFQDSSFVKSWFCNLSGSVVYRECVLYFTDIVFQSRVNFSINCNILLSLLNTIINVIGLNRVQTFRIENVIKL